MIKIINSLFTPVCALVPLHIQKFRTGKLFGAPEGCIVKKVKQCVLSFLPFYLPNILDILRKLLIFQG